MRAVLVHNPKAGEGQPRTEAIVETLRGAGWSVERTHASPKDVLAGERDAIVVAGGDGTVAEVAKKCAGSAVPIAVVPTGTANNVATSLGIDARDPLAAARGLRAAREVKVDLGQVAGDSLFVEALGVGAFATLLGQDAWRAVRGVSDARRTLARKLGDCPATPLSVIIDGRRRDGEYLFATVMNARSFGPLLCFAPRARMDDGLFDVVLVEDGARRGLVERLEQGGTRRILVDAARPVRAREIRIRCGDRWAHVDDRPQCISGDIELGVVPGAVRFLVPAG